MKILLIFRDIYIVYNKILVSFYICYDVYRNLGCLNRVFKFVIVLNLCGYI